MTPWLILSTVLKVKVRLALVYLRVKLKYTYQPSAVIYRFGINK